MIGELLHVGALAATALSTCCVAASHPRARVREFVLSLLMLVAMADVVLAGGLVAPVWWTVLLIAASLISVIEPRGRRSVAASVRIARAMDSLAGILMAAVIVLMSVGPATEGGEHSSHSASPAGLVGSIVAGCALYAAASIHRATTFRPTVADSLRSRVLGRLTPLATGASVLLMAAVLAA